MSLMELLYIFSTITCLMSVFGMLFLYRSIERSLDILIRINYKLAVKSFHEDGS